VMAPLTSCVALPMVEMRRGFRSRESKTRPTISTR
jgi:hypothetical protein